MSLQFFSKSNATQSALAFWNIGAVTFSFPLLCTIPIPDATIGHSCTRTSFASTLRHFGPTSP